MDIARIVYRVRGGQGIGTENMKQKGAVTLFNKGRLHKRVAIITGATSGIGRATALCFAREGASLVLAGRNVEALEKITEEVLNRGVKAVMKRTDVSREIEVKELIELAFSTFSDVHILCNNAGIIGQENLQPESQDGEDWQQVYAVNVLSAVYGIKYIAE
ncbi:MAG: SDR family oxidoreductase, partial [Firmicutes bacterium]|nr:SDR family oxidoreductase [Bacillota bacterium]